jgi:hypothetical protein
LIKGGEMKKIILFLLFLTAYIYPQISPPSGYTTNYRLRLYSQKAQPSADSINANWITIDQKIKLAYDSATTPTILKTYGNFTYYGNRIHKSGYLSMDGARFFFGNNTVTSPLFVGELAPTANRTYLTYTNVTNTDTIATWRYVRQNYSPQNNGYRILFNGASQSTNGNATQVEYQMGNATSITTTTTQNIKIPFYKTGDEDSLILYFRAYYTLGSYTYNQTKVRFWIDGDPPFTDAYYGSVDIVNDESYGYSNYTLKADISSLPIGNYYIGIAGTVGLDTYSSGTARIYLTRPLLMVRY